MTAKTYRVLLSGSQEWTDMMAVWKVLDEIHAEHPNMRLMHGKCEKGVDHFGELWADARGVPVERYPANTADLGNFGFLVRNGVMVETMPDVFVGLCLNYSAGTMDCARRAREVGIYISPLSRGIS
jgi:hypothetical protein